MAIVGQQAVYRLGSSRYVQAIVSAIVSGDTVELVCFSDGSAWGDGDPASKGAKVYDSIALGTGVGEWQPGTLVSDAISAATTNLATYSYTDTGDTARCALPGSGSSVSLALSTPRQPNVSRPTRVRVYGNISLTSTLLGSQNATASLLSDSGVTPSTVRGVAAYTLSGVAATSAPPYTLDYDIPAGHYYQVVAGGAGSAGVSIAHIEEQTL